MESRNIKLVTPPEEGPLTFTELCDHIKPADPAAEQADLQLKLAAAVGYVQNVLNRPLVSATCEAHFERWPCTPPSFQMGGNTADVLSLTYRDHTGTVTQIHDSDLNYSRLYDVASGDSDAGQARVQMAYGKSWPWVTLNVGEPIAVRYQAGWADAASVPFPIKAAVLLVASHYYRNREAVTMGSRAASGISGPETTPMISTPLAMRLMRFWLPIGSTNGETQSSRGARLS